jgi:hypothetical protein
VATFVPLRCCASLIAAKPRVFFSQGALIASGDPASVSPLQTHSKTRARNGLLPRLVRSGRAASRAGEGDCPFSNTSRCLLSESEQRRFGAATKWRESATITQAPASRGILEREWWSSVNGQTTDKRPALEMAANQGRIARQIAGRLMVSMSAHPGRVVEPHVTTGRAAEPPDVAFGIYLAEGLVTTLGTDDSTLQDPAPISTRRPSRCATAVPCQRQAGCRYSLRAE